MNTKTRKASGVQVTAFHNPGPRLTLGLPGERKARMANKTPNAAKKKGGSKKKKRNTASASGSSTRSASQKNPNPAKKVSSKKNSARAKRNPFAVGGLNFMELGVAGVTAIGSQAVVKVFVEPTSWAGIGLGIGLAYGVNQVAPKSINSAATVGAAVVPVINFINRVSNNTIGNTITNTIRGFIPAGLLGTGTPAPATGMGGYRRPVRLVNGQAV